MRHRADHIARAIEAGATLADASREAGLSRRTIHRWLEQGRRSEAPAHLRLFATRVDTARRRQTIGGDDALSLAELRRIIDRAARRGSVPAMQLVWQRLIREGTGGARSGAKRIVSMTPRSVNNSPPRKDKLK